MNPIKTYIEDRNITKKQFYQIVFFNFMFLICVNMGLPFMCYTRREPLNNLTILK